MFRIVWFFISMMSINGLAQTHLPKLKIREVKEYVKTINPASTCMDEYLKRRTQLIVKLSVSPAVAVAGTMASVYTGGLTAAGIATVAGVEGWGGLGYVIAGGAIGAVAGAGVVVADTTAAGVTLANNVLITKTIAEQHLGRADIYTDKLYAKYLKKSEKDLSKDVFISNLLKSDAEGTLCDGTMVNQPKIRIGTKLKFKVAKLKDLVRYLDAHSVP